MPLAVTCGCGARLEIDEKFLGKEILCPDCQKPLPTKPPPTPPPLELPSFKRVSGLAVLSLTLALVGAFITPVTIAAIALGVIALRQIAARPNKLEGVGLARAGIITGAVFTILSLAAYLSPTILGMDSWLRELAYVSRLKYERDPIVKGVGEFEDNISITKPSVDDWAQFVSHNVPPNYRTDDVILVNIRADAFIACQHINLELHDKDAASRQEKALERFYKSELVNLIGKLRGVPFAGEGVVSNHKALEGDKGAKDQEFVLDVRLGGHDRTFLIRAKTKNDIKLMVLVGGARKGRFASLEADFRAAFDSVK